MSILAKPPKHESHPLCNPCPLTRKCRCFGNTRVVWGCQYPALQIVRRLAGRKLEHDRRRFISDDQMNFCVTPTAAYADGLRAVFVGTPTKQHYNAPVPSGCTLTLVLSRDGAVTSTVILSFVCNASKDSRPDAVFGPASHPCVNGVPKTEFLGQFPPRTAVFGDVQYRLEATMFSISTLPC